MKCSHCDQEHLDNVIHRRIIISHYKNFVKDDCLIDERGKNDNGKFPELI